MRESVLVLAMVAGCAPEPLPPLAETVIVVHVDLPVPRVVARLRVDLYAEDGRWFDSRDIARPDPRDWPVSFSVYSDDEEREKRVWVRLRAYPDGRFRDYLGERFVDWSDALGEPPAGSGSGEPRLLSPQGADVTPESEPEPLLTVDRLLLVALEPGVVARLPTVLHAACAGTMAFLSAEGLPEEGQSQSCIASERLREPVEVEPSVGEPVTLVSFEVRCENESDTSRVCIPGGATLLGSRELILYPDLVPLPERVVVHRPFFVDRDEVSVARFRRALAEGFSPADMPLALEADLGTTVSTTCTWSASDRGREDYALSCLSWQTARELCQFYSGDLPSEAQWEHLATLASPRGRSRYPWGDEPPSCDRAVHGRLPLAGTPGVCQDLGIGPLPLQASAADRTPQGVIGAAGSLNEWMRDSYQDYAGPCWAASSLFEPGCFEEVAANRSVRGGAWAAPPTILASAVRLGAGASGEASFIGFRCAYPAEAAE